MFDLDAEIQAYCRSVHPLGSDRLERVAELTDHLHCEIERLTLEGHSSEEAFVAATAALGPVQSLRDENIKNAPLLSKLGPLTRAIFMGDSKTAGKLLTPKAAGVLIIGLSLAYATAMISIPLVFGDFENRELVQGLLLASWMVPYTTLSLTTAAGRKSCKANRRETAG